MKERSNTAEKLKCLGFICENLGKGYTLAIGKVGNFIIGNPETDSEGNFLIPEDVMETAQEKTGEVFGEHLKLVLED